MDGFWPWLSQLISSMFSIHNLVMHIAKRQIYLVRLLVYLLALTPRLCLLALLIECTVACQSSPENIIISIQTQCFNLKRDVFKMYRDLIMCISTGRFLKQVYNLLLQDVFFCRTWCCKQQILLYRANPVKFFSLFQSLNIVYSKQYY